MTAREIANNSAYHEVSFRTLKVGDVFYAETINGSDVVHQFEKAKGLPTKASLHQTRVRPNAIDLENSSHQQFSADDLVYIVR